MLEFRWDQEKDARLRRERGIGFQEIVAAIEVGNMFAILEHPHPERYPNQRIAVVWCREYAHLVPFVQEDNRWFFKTIIPSRKLTKQFRPEGEPGAS